MRGSIVRLTGVAIVALAAAGCGDLPTFVDQDRTIAVVRIVGCGAVAVQSSCGYTGQAWDADGNEIQNPPLVWRSSRPHIATVTGTGATAMVHGLVAGQTTISASDAAQRTSDSATLSVAPLKHGEE